MMLLDSQGLLEKTDIYGTDINPDVLDTALGVTLRKTSDLLLDRLAGLFEVVRARAIEHRIGTLAGYGPYRQQEG